MSRSVSRILLAPLWLALGLLVALALLPRFTDLDALIVRGGSMEPTIPVGAAVVIDTEERDAVSGDVVTFIDIDGRLVTHRVIDDTGGDLVTQGDANDRPDAEPVPRDAVRGTVVLDVPYAGYALAALRAPLVFFLILVFTGGFVIASELRTITREVRRMRRGGDEATDDEAPDEPPDAASSGDGRDDAAPEPTGGRPRISTATAIVAVVALSLVSGGAVSDAVLTDDVDLTRSFTAVIPADESPDEEPAESEPAESEPAESEPAESEPAESEPSTLEAPEIADDSSPDEGDGTDEGAEGSEPEDDTSEGSPDDSADEPGTEPVE